MKKTVYMSDKVKAIWREGDYMSVPVVKFIDGKWRQDNWCFKVEEEAEFIRVRKKEGFLIL